MKKPYIEEQLKKLELIEKMEKEYENLLLVLEKNGQMRVSDLEKHLKYINQCDLTLAFSLSHLFGSIELFYINGNGKEKPIKKYYYSPEKSAQVFARYTGRKHLLKRLKKEIRRE